MSFVLEYLSILDDLLEVISTFHYISRFISLFDFIKIGSHFRIPLYF